MNRWLVHFLIGLPLVVTAETIHFKDSARAPLEGEITSYGASGVTIKVALTLSGGLQGSSSETIPWSVIDHLDFPVLDGEAAILADPAKADLETLQALWMAKLPHLSQPKSNAGEVGLLYGERLLTQASEFSWLRAMDVFSTIERDDWDKSHLARAKRGRLRTLIASGKVAEAVQEAKQMAAESEEPEILLESKAVLASAAFSELQALQKEHPRWMEDDEVIPKRSELLNDALDQFLHAYLFYGSEEAAAASGLLGAAEVHRFAGDHVHARACAEDILRLYPQTPSRSDAERFLTTLPPIASESATAPTVPTQSTKP